MTETTVKPEWEFVGGTDNGRGYHVSNWILRGPTTYQEACVTARTKVTVPVEDYFVHSKQRADGGWNVRHTFDSGD